MISGCKNLSCHSLILNSGVLRAVAPQKSLAPAPAEAPSATAYLAASIRPADAALCSSAGILLCRADSAGKVDVLLGIRPNVQFNRHKKFSLLSASS
jgi:hypothetical protein